MTSTTKLLKQAAELHQRGALADAMARCQQVLRGDANHVDALLLTGSLLAQQGQFPTALQIAGRVAALDPQHPGAHHLAGIALRDGGQVPQSIAAFDRAVELAPDDATIRFNRALALVKLKRNDDALDDFAKAIDLQPALQEAWFHRGTLNFTLGRHEDALRDLDKAVALRPDHIASHVNRSSVLIALDRTTDAERGLDRIIAAAPHIADLYTERANVRHLQCRFDEAFADTAKALQLAPHDPDVLHHVSMIELAHGRFAEGWPRFEARLRRPGLNLGFTLGNWPLWKGEPLNDTMLLLVGEQGIGDCIQFSTFIPELASRGFRVGVLVNQTLAPLLATVPGVAAVFTDGEAVAKAGPFRALPIMSLPAMLGTTLDTMPTTVPFMRAAPDTVAAYRDRLGTDGFKIGLAWQGSPTFRYDRTRSIPLDRFAPLNDIPGVRLISLQKRPGAEQIDSVAFKDRLETPLDAGDLGPNALPDTAALMMNCDLIVSSCTMTAHLAGALGRPLYLALRRVPDWRWGIAREDSPWYPTARLFRQTQDGDWTGVFERIAAAVSQKIKS